jgi:hypothetical protein
METHSQNEKKAMLVKAKDRSKPDNHSTFLPQRLKHLFLPLPSPPPPPKLQLILLKSHVERFNPILRNIKHGLNNCEKYCKLPGLLNIVFYAYIMVKEEFA